MVEFGGLAATGIGHWHAHEVRRTAASIMTSNGAPIQDISDTRLPTHDRERGGGATSQADG